MSDTREIIRSLVQAKLQEAKITSPVETVLTNHGFKKMAFDTGAMVGFVHKDNGRNQVHVKGSSWKHFPEINKSPIASGKGGESLHQHLSSPHAQYYSKLEARYFHRIPKVADSPTATNLDFVHNSLRKKKRRAPMDKLVNNNGQWIR